MDRVKVCAAICRNSEKTLVFVRTKRGADRLVEQLRKEGVKADAIHGDLRQANRERTLKDFGEGKLPALVATDVAARGLRHRPGRRGHPLRPARGPQGLPAPFGSDRPCRRGRAGGHPGPVEPGPRSRAHPDPDRSPIAHRRDLLQRSPVGQPGGVAARAGTESARADRSRRSPPVPDHDQGGHPQVDQGAHHVEPTFTPNDDRRRRHGRRRAGSGGDRPSRRRRLRRRRFGGRLDRRRNRGRLLHRHRRRRRWFGPLDARHRDGGHPAPGAAGGGQGGGGVPR